MCFYSEFKGGTLLDGSVTAVASDDEATSAEDSNGSALHKEGNKASASCAVVPTGVLSNNSELTSVASLSDASAFPTDFFPSHCFIKKVGLGTCNKVSCTSGKKISLLFSAMHRPNRIGHLTTTRVVNKRCAIKNHH